MTFCRKGNSLTRFVTFWRSSFNTTTHDLTLEVWRRRRLRRTAVKCSSTHHTVRIGPLRPPRTQGLEITWRGSTTRMTTQLKKSCVAGCEVQERISTAAECLSSCSAGSNAWIVLEILYKSDRTCSSSTNSVCFLSH